MTRPLCFFFVPVHSTVLEGWIPDGEGEKVSVFLGLHALVADSVVLLDWLVLAEPGDLRHGVGLQDALHHQVVALLPTNIKTQPHYIQGSTLKGERSKKVIQHGTFRNIFTKEWPRGVYLMVGFLGNLGGIPSGILALDPSSNVRLMVA